MKKKNYLTNKEIRLYKKLLRHKYTIPGLFPMGDGLEQGLWEDVIIFDIKTYKRIAFIVIESITYEIYQRAISLKWNTEHAGLTEKQVYPKEFTSESMAIKKKHAKQWKKDGLQFYKDSTNPDGFYHWMFTGENPNKIVKPCLIQYKAYKAGVYINKENGIQIILNEYYLNLKIIKKHKDHIINTCKKYCSYKKQKQKTIFIPDKRKGYFNDNRITLSDQECLKIQKNLQKKIKTLSNSLFI